MKRILRGAVLLAVTAVIGACGTEPDQVKDGTVTRIVANPTTVLVAQGDSEAVLLRLVDQQGTALIAPITITTVGDGISVRPDSGFRPIFTTGDSLVFNMKSTELRVFVRASDAADQLKPWSFSVTSGGLTTEIPVVIFPKNEQAIAISNLTPALAEQITLTPNIGLLLTDSTKVSFAGGPAPRIVSIAPDGSSMVIVVGPNSVGPAVFSNVTVPYNHALNFTLSSEAVVTGVKVDTFFVTASTTTPASNVPVTITLSGNTPAELFKIDSSGSSFANASQGAVLLNVSADSTSAQILPEPLADDQLFLNDGLIDGFAQSLPTNVKLTVGALTPLVGTNDFASAPTIGDPGANENSAVWNGGPLGFAAAGTDGGHVYKFTTAGPQTITFTADNVADGADIRIRVFDAAHATVASVDDNCGGGGSNGESGDIDIPSAGTYYVAIQYFQYTDDSASCPASPKPPTRYRLILHGN